MVVKVSELPDTQVIKAVSGNITVTGLITSTNEASDATCFPLFITASGTQNLQPKNNAGLTFDSSAGTLGAVSFSGAGTSLTGTAASLTAGAATVLATTRAIYGNNFNGSAALTQAVGAAFGGTGVANNAASTITISGNFGSTFTVTGATTVTFPTTGTLITTAVTTLSSLTSIGTLTSLTMGGTISMVDNVLSRPEIIDYSETTQSVVATTTLALDISAGNTILLSQDTNVTTLTFTNPSPTTKACSFRIIRTKDATGTPRTIAWPASVTWAGGAVPTLSTTTGAVDIYSFLTVNAGTTWRGFVGGQAFV